jgi:hypothetical protein
MIKNNVQNRGVKADSPNGIYVRDDSVSCEEINAVYIWVSSTNWVQLGWYEVPGNGVPADCGTTTGTPRRFSEYKLNGTKVCVGASYLIFSAPSWHTFQIGNQNQDGFFSFFYDGSSIGDTTDMLFSDGWNLAGTERTVDEAAGGAAVGQFKDMYSQASGGWSLWDKVCFHDCNHGGFSGCEDTDNVYDAERVNALHYRLQAVKPSGWYDAC